MVRFGVIGCGNVSGTYLYTLSKNKNAEVVAIADSDTGKAKKSANLFGIGKTYEDYRGMLSNENLDATIICTPHYLHHEQALDCFSKKLDVLCEKPLATNMEDVFEMVEKGKRVKFGVMLQRRLYPNSIRTREVVNKGLLGKINEVSLKFSCHKSQEFYNTWRGQRISGGGTLLSQALHRIDQLVYFFGPAKYVKGTMKMTRSDIEVEDYAKGKIFFENNIVADIESNNSSGNPDTISIIKIAGDMGNIVLSDDKTIIWDVQNQPKPKEIDINTIPKEYRPEYYGPAHEIVINDFVDSIREKKTPVVSGADSIPAMQIIFGFYKSAAKKTTISLDKLFF